MLNQPLVCISLHHLLLQAFIRLLTQIHPENGINGSRESSLDSSFKSLNEDRFNVARDLKLNEETLNGLLFNVSISALSLRVWQDEVAVNVTNTFNVYSFSNEPHFFAPYCVTLFATLLFAVAGLHALHRNGLPATDGGFLQVMMATSNDSAMTRAAGDAAFGGRDDAAKEPLDMKVRYGELVGDSDGKGRNMGFGTVEETAPLRKAWGSGTVYSGPQTIGQEENLLSTRAMR